MLNTTFNLQGHRGAQGLKPENTLVSFEAAIDAGVTSIETDLHLTRDDEVVLCHDPMVDGKLVRKLTWKQIVALGGTPYKGVEKASHTSSHALSGRATQAGKFEKVTPLAKLFADERGVHPLGIPPLDDLILFTAAYAGELGQQAGKSAVKQARAARLIFDLELKRVAGRPERIGDGFDGTGMGLLEKRVIDRVKALRVLERTVVRSFDHRSVLAIKEAEPRITTAILIAGTTPVDPVQITKAAGASIYAPSADSLDEVQIKQLHASGILVLPWTVNEPADWKRLIAWGVDGMATDYPDRLAAFLRRRKIAY